MSLGADGNDPERWSDRRATAAATDGGIGDAFRRDRSRVDLGDAALARIGRVVMAGRRTSRAGSLRLRTVVLAALALLASGGVVAAARLVMQARAREPHSLILDGPGTATITTRHRRRLTLVGPGKLQLDPGAAAPGADVALESGALIVEPGNGPALAVQAGDEMVTVPATASVQIQSALSGQPAAVKALTGLVELVRAGQVPVTIGPPLPATVPPSTSPPVEPSPSVPLLVAPAPPPASPPGGALSVSAGPRPPRALASAEAHPHAAPRALLAIAPVGPIVAPTAAGGGDVAAAVAGDPARADEARLLAGAFHKLRGDRDAGAALQALDDYQRAYPGGWLQAEASLARAEALLALGREADALAALDAATFGGAVLTRDVRLARGQLLTRAGHCPAAIAEFDGVLRTRDDDATGERALAGRASCRLRAGQITQAFQDLHRYLKLFPAGPQAAQARRWLHETP